MSTENSAYSALLPDGWSTMDAPLGAHVDPATSEATFAVYAPAAVRVELEFYAEAIGVDASDSFPLALGEDGIWRGRIGGVQHGDLYAYRCWGTNWPYSVSWERGNSAAGFESDRDADGNHFNPNKVLVDPYAREITHAPMSHLIEEAGADGGIFGTGGGEWRGMVRREVDSGRYAPKGVVIHDEIVIGERPSILDSDSIIYEAHVKNLTMHPSSSKLGDLLSGQDGFEDVVNVPAELRGTYAGAAYMAPYLKALGVNTIEFLPSQQTDTDAHGDVNGTVNHWGYQTLGFFAPNRDYAHDQSWGGPTREFKQMVKSFHDYGIEVYLDVVYNHTAEGGNWNGDPDTAGFTTLGGFATTDYYTMNSQGILIDGATGSANQTAFASEAACNLVLDSLRYLNAELGVDGFRFDLAPALGRLPNAAERDDWENQRRFFKSHPLLEDVVEWAYANGVEVIAEAWDLWGYEVGNFPHGWGEWNGRFRDAVRKFAKGDGNTADFMGTFNGDWLHFNDNAGPQKSVNFITAHDGFTMFDLVSFNTKNNLQDPPWGPSDGGGDNNMSWDSGGDHALRRSRWRNFWTLLFFARGVPMVVSGDEYGRTQNGNNNPWNLNTIAMWNNWAQAASHTPTQELVDPANPNTPGYYDVVGECDSDEGVNPMLQFARFVTNLRATDVTLRQNTWGGFDPDDTQSVPYLFYKPDLETPADADDRVLAVTINGAGIGGTDYLMMINMDTTVVDFTVPDEPDEDRPELEWRRIIDTDEWAEEFNNCWTYDETTAVTDFYSVQPWSIAVLAAVPEDSPLTAGPQA